MIARQMETPGNTRKQNTDRRFRMFLTFLGIATAVICSLVFLNDKYSEAGENPKGLSLQNHGSMGMTLVVRMKDVGAVTGVWSSR